MKPQIGYTFAQIIRNNLRLCERVDRVYIILKIQISHYCQSALYYLFEIFGFFQANLFAFKDLINLGISIKLDDSSMMAEGHKKAERGSPATRGVSTSHI